MTAPKPELHWVRPPRQARSQETLDRILDTAEALVAEKGFEDTPVSEIVQRADSSVGAFYARFHDKEGLLHALYERYYDEAVATAEATLDPARWEGAGTPEMIDAVIHFLVSIFRERRGLMRAFVMRNHTHPEFQARQQRLSHHVIARLCVLLLARREQISHPDPERATRFGMMLVFSALETMILFGEMRSSLLSLSDDGLADELTRSTLAYLGVTPTPKEPR
ncbi:MAG TPA: TetR/AcrR family transcriptional regulator [Myxococcota bacterium]|jgi:AcrR family transcriptional regulator